MKYSLVKFQDGLFGARRYSWAPLFGGYKFLDLSYPQKEEWATPASYCKGSQDAALEAIRLSQIKPFQPKRDLGTPC